MFPKNSQNNQTFEKSLNFLEFTKLLECIQKQDSGAIQEGISREITVGIPESFERVFPGPIPEGPSGEMAERIPGGFLTVSQDIFLKKLMKVFPKQFLDKKW